MRKSVVAGAFLVVLFAGFGPVLAESTEDPIAAALRAFEKGDFEKVVEIIGAVAENSPSAPKASYLAGEALLQLGELSRAEKRFRDALRQKPKAVPVLVGLGRALRAQGKREEARAQLDAALKIDKKDAGALRALGELQLAEEAEHKKALKTLKAARKAAPKDPQAARALVEAYLREPKDKRASKRAESVARKQVKAAPKHPMGYFLLGLALERRGKSDDAIEAYEKAIARDAEFIDAHKNLAILCVTDNPGYRDKARTKKALVHFARYFELGGKDDALERTYRSLKSFLDRSGG